jgi:hypothetical protein
MLSGQCGKLARSNLSASASEAGENCITLSGSGEALLGDDRVRQAYLGM